MSVLLGEVRTFPQGAGPDIQLMVFGDEFYARYENLCGYTVVFDTGKKRYCYAAVAGGHLVSSGVPVEKPVPCGIVRHLQETKAVRNAKFETRYNQMRPEPVLPPGVMRAFAPRSGLLSGRQLSSGKVTGLTIIIDFADVKTSISREQVNALLNGDNYKANGNYCSVKKYYGLVSGGKLEYTNVVVGPVTVSKNRTHYIDNPVMKEALDMVANNPPMDFSRFDSRGDGIIDAINFVYAGTTLYEGNLWPHNWSMGAAHGGQISYNGIRADLYTIQSLGRSPVDLKIGTFCHEAGHLLCRFPDLYDYGRRDGDSDPSAGLGSYCLMSSGNHLNRGRTPAPVSAYLRDLAGWCDNRIRLNDGGSFTAEHGAYSTLLHYQTDRPNEYFLVENRFKTGLDQYCASSGLAIYHCDTMGSNEWQGGTADHHYQCALIQADGSRHLENNRNRGDSADLFTEVAGAALSSSTIPSSKAWGGTDSGLLLSDIGEPGSRIDFTAGQPTGNVVMAEAHPDLLIPDNDPAGAASSLTIGKAGKIEAVAVEVDITHTYIGDLSVKLESPDGEMVLLHNQKGGGADDLVRTFTAEDTEALLALAGKSMAGEWTLIITDTAAADQGRLNRWGIAVAFEAEQEPVILESRQRVNIPDDDIRGIESAIEVARAGTVKGVKVSVDIAHTYIGDLQVTLIAPWGSAALLHAFGEGGSADNLVRQYDGATFPALAHLAAESRDASGRWRLSIIDNARADTGRLNGWKLALAL